MYRSLQLLRLFGYQNPSIYLINIRILEKNVRNKVGAGGVNRVGIRLWPIKVEGGGTGYLIHIKED